MRLDVLTLFPEMFENVLGSSILKRAARAGEHRPAVVSYHLTDIRAYTRNRHGKVDRPPYGGGPGMVIQCQPVWDAVRAAEGEDDRSPTRVHMTPQGRRLDQAMVERLAAQPRLLILAGHYEGVDERVLERLRVTPPLTSRSPPTEEPLAESGSGAGPYLEEISIGDYVLSGGELPAMVLIDAIVRLLPGALGATDSTAHESFSGDLGGELDYPHYTRPRLWAGREVPPVLLGGNHARVDAWRREQANRRTAARRPDLAE